MQPFEETFVPGHAPTARVRDRTIDVDSMELEVLDARPRGARAWLGGGTLLAASVSLVVGTAALLMLDETRFRSSVASPVAPTPRASSAPSIPSPAAPKAESTSVVAQPVEQITAEPLAPPAQETKLAPVNEVAPEREKPLRKRTHAKRTRAVTSTSSRTVTKRTHRR